MKILVGISKVPDTTSKIAFIDGGTKFDATGVQFILNPYDEWYALVRALELKEANGGTVTTVTVGGADADSIIRKGLAIGADDAIRVDTEPVDSLSVAREIVAVAKEGNYDLILLGKETIDYNGSQLGGMIAELLDQPFISLASKLDVTGSTAVLDRDVEGSKEVVQVELPIVVSAAKGMAEQRIPNMRGIMAARSKPLTVKAATSISAVTKVSAYELPPAKSACKMVSADQPEELITLLRNEAKVI